MDYIEGQNLQQFKTAPYEERKRAAETLARFATLSSFRSGLVNTDAHAGNFIFCGGGRVGFIDFGRAVKTDLSGSYAQEELLRAVICKDIEMARKTIPYLPFIRNPKTFPLEEFWDFFLKQQSHLNSGDFRFTHSYIAQTLQAAKTSSFKKDIILTLEMVWSTAVSAGIWHVLAELDVEVDYGKISLELICS